MDQTRHSVLSYHLLYVCLFNKTFLSNQEFLVAFISLTEAVKLDAAALDATAAQLRSPVYHIVRNIGAVEVLYRLDLVDESLDDACLTIICFVSSF